MIPALAPSQSWLLLLCVWFAVAFVVYCVFRAGSRGARMEEEILRRRTPKVYEMDNLEIIRGLRKRPGVARSGMPR